MAEWLLELFGEEIPARMQEGAAAALARLAAEGLKAEGLAYDGLRVFSGPRRLTLVARGLPVLRPGRREERKGPRTDAPEQALAGFLRSAGVAREALVERDGAWFAAIDTPGRATADVLGPLAQGMLRAFPWPKSMRSGAGAFRWVRPLKRIVCLFDGAVAPLEVEGIAAGDLTEGHRFMGERGPFSVAGFDDYAAKLRARFVVLDAAERRALIQAGAEAAARAAGLEIVPDAGLLAEVAGLVEWPVPLLGAMDPAFLDLPEEVIRTSMRAHQKYFSVRRRGAASGLAPNFVVVANLEARDGGAAIAAGNAKVLSARLADARFFWNADRKVPLMDRLEALRGVTFHAKLGTMAERVQRVAALAREIAPLVGAAPALAETAARLAKADLTTGMVGEFPELQGVMGGYYARLEPASLEAGADAWWSGLSPADVDAVADAVRDHYRPLGPSDAVPTAPVTVAVALADKLDTLVGFFGVHEPPTGSKDPYALRRSALGVIRLVLAGQHRLSLKAVCAPDRGRGASTELLAFFADRLKVLLREEGKRHDLVDAAFALGDDDLVRIVARVEALTVFLATDDGASLLSGYKRAANILKAEEKRASSSDSIPAAVAGPDASDAPPEEGALAAALARAAEEVEAALAVEDFAAAMRALAALRAPVDAFLERVLVNVPDPAVRARRLALLAAVRDAASRVADFSRVAG